MTAFPSHSRSQLRIVPSGKGPEAGTLAECFEIRPIRPPDADLIVAALDYTAPETYYRRFHSHKLAFSADELAYLTQVDGHHHVALIAVERATGRLAAIARFITTISGAEAEMAVCVHDPYRRRGLGAELLSRVAVIAAARGLSRLRFVVQGDNRPMIGLLHRVFPALTIDGRDGATVDFLAVIDAAPAQAA